MYKILCAAFNGCRETPVVARMCVYTMRKIFIHNFITKKYCNKNEKHLKNIYTKSRDAAAKKNRYKRSRDKLYDEIYIPPYNHNH